jgi:hypothetical protein
MRLYNCNSRSRPLDEDFRGVSFPNRLGEISVQLEQGGDTFIVDEIGRSNT